MSAKERDRLKVLHEVRKRHITQKQAGVEMGLSERWVRTLLKRVGREGDKAPDIAHEPATTFGSICSLCGAGSQGVLRFRRAGNALRRGDSERLSLPKVSKSTRKCV